MINKLLILFVLLTIEIFSQKFFATVNENKITDTDRLQATFTFEGKDVNKLKNFKPPAFKDFRIFSGPNQSTSMKIINGVVSTSLSYSYILLANATGNYTIGSATIEYDGENFQTEPIQVSVVKGTVKPKEESKQSIPDAEIAQNLFIRTIVDKNRAYLGEQVTVTYKLYTRLNIAAQMSISRLPQYQGFWAEEIQTSQNISFSTEVIDGKQFSVGILKRAALFPTQTGSLEVTPFELNVPVRIQRKRNPNNIWDDFFGDPFGRGETIEYLAKSNTAKIEVLPLPENRKPESFKGAVGNFDFNVFLDKSETITNEPISIKMKINGRGNIKLLELPSFELPTGFEKYDPKINEQINRTGAISGFKEAEYLFVPRIAGIREIKPIEFSFFDPSKKSYVTLKSQPLIINIKQGTETQFPDYAGKENIRQLGDDIRFIKTTYNDISKNKQLMIYHPAFWASVALPLFALVGLIGWKRKNDKLTGNIQLLKYQKAQKIAKSRFKLAKKLLDERKTEEFYSELSLALFGYLEDKLNIPKADFTIEIAQESLRKKEIEEELVRRVKTSAEKSEFVRFAPGSKEKESMQQMYDEFSSIIIEIEKRIS
ncbi:MAG TPA: BatD family protein [Ignavibacteriaceae bacterium]|nr:BatD family protein [Ignavibacteriaceae bacterium]